MRDTFISPVGRVAGGLSLGIRFVSHLEYAAAVARRASETREWREWREGTPLLLSPACISSPMINWTPAPTWIGFLRCFTLS